MLYICSSPIGNLEDCSFRLLHTLKTVDLILSEDTRKTSILLKKYNISTPCHSFDKFSEGKKVQTYIEKLKKGANIAIISECGTPNISDPGSYIVRKCLENKLPITPIAGPSAVSTLISVSGTNCNQFIFGGFFYSFVIVAAAISRSGKFTGRYFVESSIMSIFMVLLFYSIAKLIRLKNISNILLSFVLILSSLNIYKLISYKSDSWRLNKIINKGKRVQEIVKCIRTAPDISSDILLNE